MTTDGLEQQSRMAELQEAEHGSGHVYESGSPHLRHAALRSQIVTTIQLLVKEQFDRTGGCRVLEIGAGHGGFTQHVVDAGASVTVTEMSRPSLEVLKRRFGDDERVRLVYDPQGSAVFEDDDSYDFTLCVSVLHHIPDYLGFVAELADGTSPGGTLASFQDPLWYPRRSRANMLADRGAYHLWRLGQGDLRRGLATRVRRLRNILDDSNSADMAEYHVVRSGVDEQRVERLLRARFREVETWRYWSTQSPLLQTWGTRLGLESTFGLVGRRRHP